VPGVPVRLPSHLENFGELLPLQSARSISIGMSLIQPHISALLVNHLLWSHQLLVERGELQPHQISDSIHNGISGPSSSQTSSEMEAGWSTMTTLFLPSRLAR
jgi:hypothetical protein